MVKKRVMPVRELFNGPVREYSVYANHRAIPSIMDGFKPSQRKVIYGTLHRGGAITEQGIKVSQLSSAVSLCLAADTKINVFGKTIRIDLLYELLGPEANFEISCIDPNTGEHVIGVCDGILDKGEAYEFIELDLANGEIIKVTPDHKLLTTNGWKAAKFLTEKDELINVPVINRNTIITEMIDETTTNNINKQRDT